MKDWKLDKRLQGHYCKDRDVIERSVTYADSYKSEGFTIIGRGRVSFPTWKPGEDPTYFEIEVLYAPDSEHNYLSWPLLQRLKQPELEFRMLGPGRVGICPGKGKDPFVAAEISG